MSICKGLILLGGLALVALPVPAWAQAAALAEAVASACGQVDMREASGGPRYDACRATINPAFDAVPTLSVPDQETLGQGFANAVSLAPPESGWPAGAVGVSVFFAREFPQRVAVGCQPMVLGRPNVTTLDKCLAIVRVVTVAVQTMHPSYARGPSQMICFSAQAVPDWSKPIFAVVEEVLARVPIAAVAEATANCVVPASP